VRGDTKASMTTLDVSARDRIDSIVAANAARPGPLLEVLHEVQREFGCVPPEAIPQIARGLNLSRAEVHGVVTFYHHFRSTPPGRHRLQICRAESCQAMQGDALAAHAEQRLGVRFGETTADGGCTLEAVYCLGNCACSPAILLDEEPHGRMTPDRLDELLAGCRFAGAAEGHG
jgi:formate dehydrogenase subunit gamma